MFSHPDYDGHEALLFTQDAASGLRALIAIHDTTLGPAFGGCRMYPYASEHHAMTDVLRLSRGMTYKAAICELPYGGGKSVMIADPRRDKTPALLHAMGRIIEGLGGRYITAEDVGTTLADLIIMREVTCRTAGATAAAQQALPATAFGVFEALRAAAEVCLGRSDLEGLRVAVQGLGNVGMPLCGYLSAAGAALVVSDLDGNRCAQAAASYGATLAAPEEIHAQHVDVFAPAALDWFKVYDIIEALHAQLAKNDRMSWGKTDAAQFTETFNAFFIDEGIGWQLVDGKIVTRGTEAFETMVTEAASALETSQRLTAANHLHEALEDLSRRPKPDLPGVAYHAMGSLECVARDLTGDPKATLGEILKRHPGLLPKPLDTALSQVWGYASNEARHVLEGREINREEAELLVGLAASVGTYLSRKQTP